MSTTDTTAIDPVCGMTVSIKDSLSSPHEGQTYYFCSASCQDKFQWDPAGVLAARAEKEASKHGGGAGHGCCGGKEVVSLSTPTETKALDPVCGMTVSTKDSLSSTHDGQTYYFCSASCQDKFQRDPAGVLAARAEKEASEQGGGAGHSCCGGNEVVSLSTPAEAKALDPVCGMTVSTKDSLSSTHDGQT